MDDRKGKSREISFSSLEQLGLVTRQPGVPRSVRAAISEGQIPALEEVERPPW
jgi:hypothetical protein